MAADYYVWRVPGKPVEVRLNLSVVQRIGQSVSSWLDDGGTNGEFGMLLGAIDSRKAVSVATIQDFKPLDVARFNGRPSAPEGLELAGLYHCRPGQGMRLDHLDASLISASFDDPGMVYLMIDPRRGEESRATFFIQEQGEVHGYACYLEFPFSADQLKDTGPLTGGGVRKRRLGWIPIAALGAASIGSAGFLIWPRAHRVPDPSPPVAQQTTIPAATPEPSRQASPKQKPLRPGRKARAKKHKNISRKAVAAEVMNSRVAGSPTTVHKSRWRRLLARVRGSPRDPR